MSILSSHVLKLQMYFLILMSTNAAVQQKSRVMIFSRIERGTMSFKRNLWKYNIFGKDKFIETLGKFSYINFQAFSIYRPLEFLLLLTSLNGRIYEDSWNLSCSIFNLQVFDTKLVGFSRVLGIRKSQKSKSALIIDYH